jgi:hypothetical protein
LLPFQRDEIAGAFAPTPEFGLAYGLAHQLLGSYILFPSGEFSHFLSEMSTRYYLPDGRPELSGFTETPIPNGKNTSYAYEDPNPRARVGIAVNCTYSDHDLLALRKLVKDNNTPLVLPTRARGLHLTGDPKAKLWNLDLEPDNVSWTCSCAVPTVFFLRDSYSRSWKGQVDAAPADLFPMNAGLFRAVVCPAGEHEIHMSYEPCPAWTLKFRALFLAVLVPFLALSYGLRGLTWRELSVARRKAVRLLTRRKR